ncbi:MAG: polysaccharide deacetylase family protein [Caldilineae bacterium]|nr:polysaccharide deacetylase family protein [Anaerolineae bacterium]MCB9152597.1 polysaccharide deacetylase family protein [Caldilineae bacterium]
MKHPFSQFTSTNLVMTFHSVPSDAFFRRALETIGRWYRFVEAGEVREFFHGGRRFNNGCLVTFDDGERSFADQALPVLEAMDVPAVLFVSPGVLGSGRNYWFQDLRTLRAEVGDDVIRQAAAVQLGVPAEKVAGYGVPALMKSLQLEEIRHLLDDLAAQHGIRFNKRWNLTLDEIAALDHHSLVTIGAHSMHHPILANETDGVAEQEIAGSVAALHALLGRSVDLFAYPNGARGLDFGVREQQMLREWGVRLAFATDTGFFDGNTDPLAIPRAALSGDESVREIQARLAAVPVWDRLRTGRERKEREARSSTFSAKSNH